MDIKLLIDLIESKKELEVATEKYRNIRLSFVDAGLSADEAISDLILTLSDLFTEETPESITEISQPWKVSTEAAEAVKIPKAAEAVDTKKRSKDRRLKRRKRHVYGGTVWEDRPKKTFFDEAGTEIRRAPYRGYPYVRAAKESGLGYEDRITISGNTRKRVWLSKPEWELCKELIEKQGWGGKKTSIISHPEGVEEALKPLSAQEPFPAQPKEIIKLRVYGATGWKNRPKKIFLNDNGYEVERAPYRGSAYVRAAREVELGYEDQVRRSNTKRPCPRVWLSETEYELCREIIAKNGWHDRRKAGAVPDQKVVNNAT